VLVAGLLLVGHVAAEDGLFEAAGSWLSQLPGGVVALYAMLLALVASVTAILNLDTAALLLTPVLVHAARSRGAEERAFLYGAVFMANSASLILPGANLTNLIVLSREDITGATFAARIWPAWAAAVVVTGVAVALLLGLRQSSSARERRRPRWNIGLGVAAIGGAAALVLGLPRPAVPVLVLGLIAVALRRSRARDVLGTVSPLVLAALFAVAVALGTLARAWEWPEDLANDHGRWVPALVAAAGSVLVNNLPASVLLSARPPLHPRALLVGLDLGPNLFVTGSLSVFLWWRAAKLAGARPSIGTYARVGVVVAPLSILAALVALRLAAEPWL
jgi:arsenical pump membrane protein